MSTTAMDMSKQTQGTAVVDLTYEAVITIKDEKDRDAYNQCIEWRQNENDNNRNMGGSMVAQSASSSMFGHLVPRRQTETSDSQKPKKEGLLGFGLLPLNKMKIIQNKDQQQSAQEQV